MTLRAAIIGAGRIGCGFNWSDDAYTHAGAYRHWGARVKLGGVIEKDPERRSAAQTKWAVPVSDRLDWLMDLRPDIVSICTNPEDRHEILDFLRGKPWLKGVWCEKPWKGGKLHCPTQVNYMRRADPAHQFYASKAGTHLRLVVYGKPDETTMCHFYDLSYWWKVPLEYRDYNGPCAYILETPEKAVFFDKGGVEGGPCFSLMLANLIDHVENPKIPLFSPV